MWKVRHGQPLYEGLNLILSNTLYNFMYYKTAWPVAKTLNIDGDDLMLSSRLTSSLFAILGAIVGIVTLCRFRRFRNRLTSFGRSQLLFYSGLAPVPWVGGACRRVGI